MLKKDWLVEFSHSSLRSLERLDNNLSDMILRRIDVLGAQENPLRHKDVRPLEGKLKGFYRYRIGEYRVIFELDTLNRRIGILSIVSRQKGY